MAEKTRQSRDDTIEEYQLSDGRLLKISYDSDIESPRERDNVGKLCLREHRRYTFPNELDYDFENEAYNSEDTAGSLTELQKQYYIFMLDCYEHSGITFSLAGQGMQCQFDTAKNCGFIAIPRKDKLPNENIWTTRDEESAKNIAKNEIETYNKYLNGEVYRYGIYKSMKFTSEDGQEKIEREFEDGCSGYYDIKDILSEFDTLSPKKVE